MRTATIIFTVFLTTVILLANFGYMRPLLRFLGTIPHGDKILHFFLVGILNFLMTTTFMQSLPSRDPKWVAVSVGFVLAMIFTVEELSQDFFRGRNASLRDLLANYAGIVFFGVAAWVHHVRRKT
jgi:polysaccharide biosynthesis protein VpsQ